MGWLSYFLIDDIGQDTERTDLTDEIVRLQDVWRNNAIQHLLIRAINSNNSKKKTMN